MKTIKKQLKRAFTIVELVIVIAVVAALAAILIPTFANVINSANESADTSLVKNLNTILTSEQALNNGKQPSTMGEALEWVESNGYKVESLTPASSGDILWNQETNSFLLVNSDSQVVYADSSSELSEGDTLNVDYTYWYVVNDSSEYTAAVAKGYSLYINTELEEVEAKGGVEYAEGITSYSTIVTADATSDTASANEGKTAMSSIKTATAAASSTANLSVIIKTNGGTLKLTVSGEATHYGTAETVRLEGSTVYNKNATVTRNIEIASADVGIVPSSTETDTLSIVLTDAIAKSEDAETIVNMLAENCADVTVVVGSTSSDAATILASVSSSSTVTVVTTTISTDYAGGLGTEASPYQIATAEQFANINKLNFANNSYYFVQTADITVTSTINYFSGTYDGYYNGNYYTLKVSNTTYMIYYIQGHCTVKNLIVDMDGNDYTLFYMADWATSYGIDVDNITFNSDTMVEANSNNYGLVVGNAIYTADGSYAEYNFTNITNNANIQNEGTCTGFIVGSGPCFNVYTVLNYENCTNNGTITGSQNVGFIYGNSAYIGSVVTGEINVTNCINNGTLRSIQTGGTAAFAPGLDTNEKTKELYAEKCTEWQMAAGGVFRASNFFNENNNGFEGVNQSGTTFAVSATSTDITYKLVLSVQATYFMADGSDWNTDYESDLKDNKDAGNIYVSNNIRYFAALTTDSTITGTLNSFHAYDVANAIEEGIIESADSLTFTNGFAIVVKDGTNYMIIDKNNSYYIDSNVTVYVYAYDANGNLIGMKNI